MSEPILFLLGPSGAGKSTLAGWVAEDFGFVHVEIDQFPVGDGIDLNGLRPEWDTFLNTGQAHGFAAAIRGRVERVRAAGAVLSFPSNLVLSVPHMAAAAAAGIQCFVLYGPWEACLASFQRREEALDRGLDLAHWVRHNAGPHAAWAGPDCAPYRLAAYEGSARRGRADLVTEVKCRVLTHQATRA
jgi:hypothetical protein